VSEFASGSRRAVAFVLVALALAVGGCSASHAGGAPVVKVFAAASLTETFTQLGKNFEAGHAGARVEFTFAGSSQLAQQITQGAPAGVFAAASPATMKTVTDAGLADGPPAVFVRNQLVIAVRKGNAVQIANLADLARPGLKVTVCAPQVPCGDAARKVLDGAGLKLTPATLEQDVKAALTKVRLGEADTALVYRTDARAASAEVDTVEFPESSSAVNDYQIVVLRKAPAAARDFVAFVRSDEAAAVLRRAGFQQPAQGAGG